MHGNPFTVDDNECPCDDVCAQCGACKQCEGCNCGYADELDKDDFDLDEDEF